ncbi:MAG: hypothetical protein MI725_10805 [Pirellulales bacterium]|nr:hypothetical protein [Pirellulales bacterium]
MTPVEQLLGGLVKLLSDQKIPYALIGGWAVRAYGVPRATYDVDVTISLSREQLSELFVAIDALGYDVDDTYQSGWTDTVAGMPLVKAKTFVDGRTLVADLFLAETPFLASLIDRKQLLPVNGFKAWVATPEDIVLLKLMAGRHRDLGDVQDILFMQGQLDETYLRRWAETLGVVDALQKAWHERLE